MLKHRKSTKKLVAGDIIRVVLQKEDGKRARLFAQCSFIDSHEHLYDHLTIITVSDNFKQITVLEIDRPIDLVAKSYVVF